MMLDLSTINPNDVEPLREIVRKTRDDQRNSCFTVHWKGNYHCKLFIGKQPEHLLDGLSGAFHTRHGLLIRNYGNKQKNAYYHEAGFAGTLLHEWCHRMQWFCSSNRNDGWYDQVSHLHQDQLYAKWVDICDVPLLAFDHNDIVESGLLFLRHELNHELTSELLPRKFTLSQLQELHEIVLNQKFDKRNFRKQVISKGLLKETKEKQKGVSHKPARLYSFKNLN